MPAHHVRTTFKLLQMPDFIALDLRRPIGLCEVWQLASHIMFCYCIVYFLTLHIRHFFSLLVMCYVFMPTCIQCHVKVPPFVKNMACVLVILVVIMLKVK